MLDFLLRWANWRNFIILGGTVLALSIGWQLRDYPLSVYRARLYPAAAVAPPPPSEILQEKEKRDSQAVQRRYVALMVSIQQARSDGFDVTTLEEAARAVLPLNRPGYREAAVRKLNEIEMAVPRKKSQYIPMATANSDDLDPEDIPQDVPAAPAKKKPAKKKRR